MKNLICLCIRRPITMIMILAALFIGGIVSFFSLPINRLPEINFPRVMIETFYPGMGPEEIRGSLTIPIEDAMSTVKGLEGIKSISRDGSSLVILSFRWGTDPSAAAALAREAIDTVYPALPAGAGKPSVITGSPDDEPHALVAVRSQANDMVFARNLAEYEFRSRFRRADGAGGIILSGGEKEEIRINVNPERGALRGYNGDELAGIIASETADIPGGSVLEGSLELTVVSAGRPKALEELEDLVLPTDSGPIRLADFAVISRDKAPKKSLFVFQNEEQTCLEIYRRPGADPVRLSREIKKIVNEINKTFGEDIECTLVYDASSSILESAINLIISAALGSGAVAVILFFFMKRARFSFLAAMALPVSAAAALIVLLASGRSLNSMSLGGLALGVGLVSDCSVIVLDLLRKKSNVSNKKNDPMETACLAASVSGSSFAGTLTTVVVFLPVIFLPGPLGALFGDLAAALISSVIMGWLYSQFFLPSLFCLFPPSEEKPKKTPAWELYHRRLLKASLRHPALLIGGAVVFSLGGAIILLSRPLEFTAPETVKEIELSLDFPAGTLPQTASREAVRISNLLSVVPGISFLSGRMGAEDEDAGRRADPDYRKENFLFRCFLKKGVKAASVLEKIRSVLDAEDKNRIAVSMSYPKDKTSGILDLSSVMTLAVRGIDRAETYERSEESAETIRNAAGSALASVKMRPAGTRPELRIIPDREVAASLGISAARTAGVVYAATEGIIAGDMEIDGHTLDIRVTGDLSAYSNTGLEKLPIAFQDPSNENRVPLFLGSMSRVEWRETDAALARQDRGDVVYLDLRSSPEKEKELSSILKKTLPGISRADESAFRRYGFSLAASLALVIVLLYLSLAAQFESFILPFILMMSIPFSLAGAGPALLISGSAADSGSVLGLIVLFGLAVNNGLVLYEIGEEKLRAGFSPVHAVFSGALDRFKPVLITSLTTIFALAPMAIIPGSSQRSSAAAMLGGICASTALCFFAMPPVFIVLMKFREARNGK